MELPLDRQDVVTILDALHRAHWKLDKILVLLGDDDEEEAEEADS
jgi:hypothetical protein